jgi:hypothetical protein
MLLFECEHLTWRRYYFAGRFERKGPANPIPMKLDGAPQGGMMPAAPSINARTDTGLRWHKIRRWF